jgi:cyclase
MDIFEGRVVKGIKFCDVKDAGDPVQIAKAYSSAGADELVFLDITATVEGRKITLDTVKGVADNVSIPFIVGGGISDIEDIERILNAGADKVSINTAALKNPQLITEAATRFGSNKIIIAIDAGSRSNGPGWDVYIKGGSINYEKDVLEWALEAERLGAGEILLTSMDKDGTKSGYDIELTKNVSENVNIPVIASGGAGTKEHFCKVLTDGKANAALAASLFHFKEIEIEELKKYLKDKGLNV